MESVVTCSEPGSWGPPRCCGSEPAGCCVCWCEPALVPGAPRTHLCSGRSCWSGRQSSDRDGASALTPASSCMSDTLYSYTNGDDRLLITRRTAVTKPVWVGIHSASETINTCKLGLFNYYCTLVPTSSQIIRSYVVYMFFLQSYFLTLLLLWVLTTHQIKEGVYEKVKGNTRLHP